MYGCQFHPEKSGDVGLRILRRFVDEASIKVYGVSSPFGGGADGADDDERPFALDGDVSFALNPETGELELQVDPSGCYERGAAKDNRWGGGERC